MRAREADALSAFGGIVGLNRPIDLATAQALTSTFIEAVIAPGLVEAADVRACLATKTNLRVVTAQWSGLEGERDARTILGAWLVQARDRVAEAAAVWPCARGAARGHEARADARRVGGAAVRVACVRAREVERRDLHVAGRDAGGRRRADEPRRCGEGRRAEGRRAAARIRRGVGCVLPLPRRAGCRRGRRRDGRGAAGRLGQATRTSSPPPTSMGLAMVFTGRRHFRH